MSNVRSASFDWLKRLALFALTVMATLPLLAVMANPKPAAESAREKVSSGAASPHSSEPIPRHFVVEVTGRDFRWQFRVLEPVDYANDDRSDAASHLLSVPAGAIIDWKLTSDDYIYTFTIPSLGIHEVAAPDVLRQWRSGPLERGSYELLADPICSFRFYHDDLMGRLTVKAESAEAQHFTR